MSAFTRSVTWRPKANFAELMGLDIVLRPGENQPGYTEADIERLVETDPAIHQNRSGFFATAINSGAEATTTAQYKSTDGTTGTYELESHLEARQAKVLAYADSLRLRGLRG